jgi:DNA-binding FadR family transcriptional regulator
LAFEERFWRAVARAGKNRILVMEVAWWYRVLTTRPRAEHLAPTPLASRVEFYRQLARRLAGRGDPVRYYRDAVRPILEALTAPSRSSAAKADEPSGRPARKRGSR